MGFGDTMKNKAEELGGKAKELAGKATGDHDLEAEGNVDQTSGKAKELGNKLGEKLDGVKEAVADVADKARAHLDAAANKIKKEDTE